MSTGTQGTHDRHLDLEDLIAAVNGQAVDDQAREHLARCPACQAEANRWDLIAAGIHGLAAGADAAPDAAQAARPPHQVRRLLTGSRRRTVLTSSAAAGIVLLAAIGAGTATGFVHISVGSGSPGSSAALTAVSGCASLELASGTIEQINGTSLIIKTASGQPVTVTTTPSTFLSTSAPLVRQIPDGTQVRVSGTRSAGTVTAGTITTGQPLTAGGPTRPGSAVAAGTVTGATATGFTVLTAAGTRVPVTTSGDTLVIVVHATLAQLRDGTTTYAIGQAGPDGTLAAREAITVTQPPNGVISVHARSCSPSSIAEALGSLNGG
jgi:hypothetical protein